MTDHTAEYLDAATEYIYQGLFGLSRSDVNAALGLPDDASEDARRDAMGILALRGLSTAEKRLTMLLQLRPSLVNEPDTLFMRVYDVAFNVGRALFSDVDGPCTKLLTVNYGDNVL